MLKLLGRRILFSIPLFFLVSIATFLFQSFLPGDPARSLLGENSSPERYAALREELHLGDPLLTQWWNYMEGVFHGDLGRSIFTGEDVRTTIAQRLPVTLSLIVAAVVLASAVGVVLGVQSATRGGFWRRVVDVLSLLGSALPGFWIALVLVAIFAVSLHWLPATGYSSFSENPGQWAKFLILPVVALSLHGIAAISKVTRDGMMSALQMDSTRTLRAAGVPRASLVWKHGLRNSSVGIATMVGLTAVHFVAAVVFVESVFALPGIGLLVVGATNNHDLPVLEGVTLTVTLLVVIFNLMVDLSYGILNPKVRLS